jgi:hypothetical protein
VTRRCCREQLNICLFPKHAAGLAFPGVTLRYLHDYFSESEARYRIVTTTKLSSWHHSQHQANSLSSSDPRSTDEIQSCRTSVRNGYHNLTHQLCSNISCIDLDRIHLICFHTRHFRQGLLVEHGNLRSRAPRNQRCPLKSQTRTIRRTTPSTQSKTAT